MADAFSCSFSSSDESKEKESSPLPQRNPPSNLNLTSALQSLINASVNNTIPKAEIKNVLLSLDDSKFAELAAASNSGSMLEDETSPVDSIVCSFSEATEFGKKKMSRSSSNSKDVNEKLTLSPPTPGKYCF